VLDRYAYDLMMGNAGSRKLAHLVGTWDINLRVQRRGSVEREDTGVGVSSIFRGFPSVPASQKYLSRCVAERRSIF
jgi:hypothetical protein